VVKRPGCRPFYHAAVICTACAGKPSSLTTVPKSLFGNVYNNMYNIFVRFTWDERKRKSNIRKHGLDFRKAHKVFAGATFCIPDRRLDYGEERFVTLGLLDADVVVIVHTETKDEIRIISMRKGTTNEQKIFFENI
jgi:hypothetical protein